MAPGTSPWRSRRSASASRGRRSPAPAPWPRRWPAPRACPSAARGRARRRAGAPPRPWGSGRVKTSASVHRLVILARLQQHAPARASSCAVARSSCSSPFSADTFAPRGSGWPRRRHPLGGERARAQRHHAAPPPSRAQHQHRRDDGAQRAAGFRPEEAPVVTWESWPTREAPAWPDRGGSVFAVDACAPAALKDAAAPLGRRRAPGRRGASALPGAAPSDEEGRARSTTAGGGCEPESDGSAERARAAPAASGRCPAGRAARRTRPPARAWPPRAGAAHGSRSRR